MTSNEEISTELDAMSVEPVAWHSEDGGLNVVGKYWPTQNARAMVVIVHGTGDHIGRFEWLANQLNQRGYAVFGSDWRGNGLSEGKRGYVDSFEVLLNDLQLVIDRAAERSSAPMFLYGQSFGGLKSIYFAMRRNSCVAGIIASSPALKIAIDPPLWKLLIGRTVGKFFPKISLPTGIHVEQLTHDAEAQHVFREDRLRHNQICGRTFFSMIETGQWVLSHANQLKVPTLLMHGDQDTVTNYLATRQFAESNPAFCEFKSWDGMRHELHNEIEKVNVVNFVSEWIQAVLGRQKNGS